MTMLIIADAEDPTTQVAWPASKRSQENLTDSNGSANGSTSDVHRSDEHPKSSLPVDAGKHRLSTWNLITLSISMAGAQIAWTVELGYGTPFLLTLGVSEQLTSLVWLAGPISGLIAQPLIGAISDSSASKYRRRYWIALSTGVLVLSTITLAYCEAIAAFIVDLFGVGAGDWDAKRTRLAGNTAIGIAVFQFYLLDFALNALQASLRNLLLDITPSSQLNAGNAWHGRMTHLGNIVGFGFGFLPLAKLPLLNLLGGDQFRKFCILAMAILVLTVWITFFFHEEIERDNTYRKQSKFRDVLENIVTAVVQLPKPIRRVCYVQVFAFMGWFPFLFYSTTYVGQVMAYENGEEPDGYDATRKGEFAMLLYSLVAVAAGTLLPHLAGRDRRLMPHKGDVDENAEISRLKNTVRQWRAEASRRGKPLRLPVMPFLLRNIWTGALLLFSIITFSTFFITTVVQATVAISLVGICWAVACWVPFAIIMELLKELDKQKLPVQAPLSAPSVRRPSHGRAISTPSLVHRDGEHERQPLIRRRSFEAYDAGVTGDVDVTPVAGGTVLGIHNLAIVFPQLIVAVAASLIFRLVDDPIEGAPHDDNKYLGKNGVAWVLRFGGLCTLVAAALARKVPPTPTEKAMRRRLGEMRELQQETSRDVDVVG